MVIGIIDSGINRAFVNKKTAILSDTQFVYQCADNSVSVRTEYLASDLHGTLVLNTVEKYKGNADNQYIVCNVYDTSGAAHIEAVLEALRFLEKTDVEMIVISLTVSLDFAEPCREELRKLDAKGVAIFVSYSNDGKESGLLCNPFVYGVDKLPTQAAKKWQYKPIKKGLILADARPELIPMGDDRFFIFQGTSKANALTAGLFSEKKNLKSTKKSKELIEKIQYRADDVGRSKISSVYNEIVDCIIPANEIEYEELSGDTELSEILDKDEIAVVLQHVASNHQLCVDYSSLPFEMFQNLEGIECFIEYHEKKAAGDQIGAFKQKAKRFVHKYRLNTVFRECVKYFKYNFIQIVVSLACSSVVFLTPMIEQHIVDDGIEGGRIRVLCIWAGALVINAIVQKVFDVGNSIVSMRVGNIIEMDLRGRLVEKIASVKSDGFTNNDSGKLDTLIKSDFAEFNSIITTGPLSVVVSLFELAFATTMMLHYNFLLGSIVFVIQVVSIFVISGQFDKLEKSNTYLRDCFITQNRVLNDIIINIRWIRLIGAKEFLIHQYRTAMQNKSRQLERATFLNLKVSSFDDVISSVGSAIMYLLGGFLIIKGHMTMGMLVGFIQYAGKFSSPVSGLISEVTSYRSSIAAISDICDYLEESGARFAPDHAQNSLSRVDRIEVDHLSFSYEEKKEVFKDANATFSNDRINYIIGPSGSGKSTLVQLICGGFLPQKGSVLINGTDAQKMENIEQLITYVPQRPIILNDTVYNNLTLGATISEEELIRICKDCCIYDEIMHLPMGFETQMGEAGTCFSGGELQRIALARALLRKEPILLLDECTSALDTETEIKIRNQIEGELTKRLSIIITHSEYFILPEQSRVFSVHDGKIVLERQTSEAEKINDPKIFC